MKNNDKQQITKNNYQQRTNNDKRQKMTNVKQRQMIIWRSHYISLSKYFPPFPSPFVFFSAKNIYIFLLQIKSSFSFSVFLLLYKKDPSPNKILPFLFFFSGTLIKFVERNVGKTDHCPPLGEVQKLQFRLCRQYVKKVREE